MWVRVRVCVPAVLIFLVVITRRRREADVSLSGGLASPAAVAGLLGRAQAGA